MAGADKLIGVDGSISEDSNLPKSEPIFFVEKVRVVVVQENSIVVIAVVVKFAVEARGVSVGLHS